MGEKFGEMSFFYFSDFIFWLFQAEQNFGRRKSIHQYSAKRSPTNTWVCDRQQTLAIRIATIPLASDSAITIPPPGKVTEIVRTTPETTPPIFPPRAPAGWEPFCPGVVPLDTKTSSSVEFSW